MGLFLHNHRSDQNLEIAIHVIFIVYQIYKVYSNFTCQPKNVLFDKRKNYFLVQDQKLLLSPSFISALIFMISSLI